MAKAEPVITVVAMDDGRTVDFAGKQKLRKEVLIKDGVAAVRMDFINGETRTFTVPDTLMLQFAAHGASQKLGDETSGLVDVEDSIMAIDDLMERLNAGNWNVKRESNGMAGTSVLARALVEHSGKDIATIRTFLLGKTHAEKVALRSNQAIKPIIERLEANKTAKVKPLVDTDSMLDALTSGNTAEAGDEVEVEGE